MIYVLEIKITYLFSKSLYSLANNNKSTSTKLIYLTN